MSLSHESLHAGVPQFSTPTLELMLTDETDAVSMAKQIIRGMR
jgi:hypothetical protein